nr:CAMK/CAMKL protein kinase [Kwoniella mangroviensis CBS 8507]OCF67346.1 CAMK/CAMKL protein kinase [Kwoniella mangroviensis CBS 8507]
MVNTTQPKLNKPKSKIRLRLGLGSPDHKAKQPQTQQHLSPNPSPNPLLASSTSTSNSGISRTDSRSAFTYDSSSTPSPPHKTEFDTISYNTISPESLIYQQPNGHANHIHGQINESSSTLITSSEGGVDGEYHVDYPSHHHQQQQQQQQVVRQEQSYYGESGEEEDEKYDNGESTLHPAISSITSGTDDIFSITDQQLSDRFTFISEIGFGNWGSVWLCKPKHTRSSHLFDQHNENERAILKLGKKAAVSGGTGAGGKVAIKLVHRSRSATTAARVRALWGEMKIIRSLRYEPHPSIIQFEAFVITPTYAIVIMPHLAELIPVCLPPSRATPYLRQLASAVAYLHERGITHNDIKPANVLLSHNDIPVLVDFGFAQRWDVNARGSFLSSISWGTPEYLDPIRAMGMPHDERASDVWSLGITMFEILIGRTPFEENEEEQFATPEALKGKWVGKWSMPEDLENLLRHMIQPDPAYRMTAMQAYHHPALQPAPPSVIITPHFVRAAASFDGYDQEPIPVPSEYTEALAAAKTEKKKKRKTKKEGTTHHHHKDKDTTRHSHRATTPALGESIKQHTSISKATTHNKGDRADDKENVNVDAERALNKLVIRKREEEIKDKEDDNDDPTPTKVLKPAQPLRIKELSLIADKKVVPRTSNSNLTNFSRPTSSTSQNTTQGVLSHAVSTSTIKDKRVSAISTTSPVPKSKEEAVLKTMKSLEGTRKLVHAHTHDKAAEAIAAVKRHAPEPPRPKSLDSAVELKKADSVSRKEDERRSLGVERAVLVDVREEEVDIKVKEGKRPVKPAEPMSPPREQRSSANRVPTPSPQKIRRAGRKPQAEMDVLRGKVFPASDDESPLSELRDKILVSDQEKLVRFRQISGRGDQMEVLAPSPVTTSKQPSSNIAGASTTSTQNEVRQSVDSYASTLASGLTRTRSVEALEMDGRLDKMSNWIKSVESIIEDARKAIAEGREPPLPLLTLSGSLTVSDEVQTAKKTFGLTPDKAIPSHLRTSSTQVEPSTPPKWANNGGPMDIKEAEEKVKMANKWLEEQGRKGKKDRPTVSHVLKLFGTEKGTEKERPVSGSRSNTPDIAQLVPLKPPATSTSSHALKGAPSTPALRSSTTRGLTKVPMRKSESNLRNFNTMPVIPSPSFVAGPEYDPLSMSDEDADHKSQSGLGSPRRVMFENLLSTEPGVIRQGEGWGSLSSGKGFMMAVKPSSSMASLRERARALLGDSNNHIHGKSELSRSHSNGGGKLEKRSSKLNLQSTSQDREIPSTRPNTPGAQSVLTLRTVEGHKKGWLKSLKGAMGMGKKMDKVEEGL